MRKDSICKECRWRKCVVFQEKGMEGVEPTVEEQTSCKQMAAGEMAGDVKVLECSEFERIQKPFPKI